MSPHLRYSSRIDFSQQPRNEIDDKALRTNDIDAFYTDYTQCRSADVDQTTNAWSSDECTPRIIFLHVRIGPTTWRPLGVIGLDVTLALKHLASSTEIIHYGDPLFPFINISTSSDKADSAISLSPTESEERLRGDASSQNKNQTPAQARREAQNRAAQRAFRERKERRVKDLENQLDVLTTKTDIVHKANERLKRLLQQTQTDNEVLKANVYRLRRSSKMDAQRIVTNNDDGTMNLRHDDGSNIITQEKSVDVLLSPTAAWEAIQAHPLCRDGTFELDIICERLKQLTRLDPLIGLAFEKAEINRVIEDVARFNDFASATAQRNSDHTQRRSKGAERPARAISWW
ncbi:AP-1-like transcription factor [Sphaceloma murrayae]|uniref:AP-1-like transcription factor n=1 Tax=Sphaceloma murrayae TaxID=2082308 RepID=A0A2K1QX24_9PEZI|nr:AP-1-like transcription factor [Sphaceloma murrayae]